MDRTGDGGAVDPVQHRQGLVRELEPQHHQGRQHAVTQDQPLLGPGPGGPPPRMAASAVQRTLVGGGPGVGQLSDQVAKVFPGQPGKARMGEGRTGPCWFGHPRMIARTARLRLTLMLASRCRDQPWLYAHQVVRLAVPQGDQSPADSVAAARQVSIAVTAGGSGGSP
jgi:hypothetical protein